jgi:hypothetical protein
MLYHPDMPGGTAAKWAPIEAAYIRLKKSLAPEAQATGTVAEQMQRRRAAMGDEEEEEPEELM